MLIADAKPGSDRGTKRHYGDRARIGQLATDHRVLGAIRQYDEAFRYERLGSTHEFFGVWIEQFAVANDFELNPAGAKGLASECGGEHSILRCLAAGGIGQELDVLGNEIEQALVIACEADAPNRGRDHFRTACGERVEHHLPIRIAGSAKEET